MTTISLFGQSKAGISSFLERLATGDYGKDTEERKSLTMVFGGKSVTLVDGYDKEANVYFFMYDIGYPSHYRSFVDSLRFQEIKASKKKLYILATKFDTKVSKAVVYASSKISNGLADFGQLAKNYYVVSSKSNFQTDKAILSALQ